MSIYEDVSNAFLSTDIGGVLYLKTSGLGDFSFDLLNSTIAENLDSSGGNVNQNEHALIYFYIGNEAPVRHLNIQNCIMYNNDKVDKTIAPYHSPGSVYNNMSLNNCISEIDSYADSVELNNVSIADPMFTDALSGHYTLKAGSPAINSGSISGINYLATDLAGNERINSSTIDIGCYEYQRTASVFEMENNLQFIAYPNPTNGVIRIKSSQHISSIDVLNSIGQVAAHFVSTNSIDISHLPNGLYFIKAHSKNDLGVKQPIKK